ncbi:hypothetical protein GCM10018790_63530 [Kitasatospora xanthocidica]|nr:hypothetical protein GCM10018790_63530 [Kitasatospora xanthocidica]
MGGRHDGRASGRSSLRKSGVCRLLGRERPRVHREAYAARIDHGRRPARLVTRERGRPHWIRRWKAWVWMQPRRWPMEKGALQDIYNARKRVHGGARRAERPRAGSGATDGPRP